MATVGLPDVHAEFPDEAHEALRRYVDRTTVGVDDLAMAMQALAQLANTFFAALDASLADRAKLRTDVDALTPRVTATEAKNTAQDAAITAETTRATAAEKTVTDNLAAEITRATQAEGALATRVAAAETKNTQQDAALTAEITRATAAEKALSDAASALTARVTALEARSLVGTTGQLTKNLTLGVGGQTTVYDVTFAKAMPSTAYVLLVTLDSSSVSLLGSVSVVYPITNKTTTGCTVTVRNTAAVTLASSVTVQVAAIQIA